MSVVRTVDVLTAPWRRVWWPDAALAVILCLVGVSQPLLGWHDGGVGEVPSGDIAARVLLALPLTLPLVWRRGYPVVAAATVGAAVAAQVLVVPYVPFLAGLVPLVVAEYSAAAHGARARLLGLLAPVASVGVVMARVPEERVPGELLFSAFVLAGTWLAGSAVHDRLQRAGAEVTAARRGLVEHQERLARARAEERALIARELHDVVSHTVSLMGIQAGAARTELETDPVAARRTLLSVEESARSSVAELQRLLRLLREPPATADLHSAPAPIDRSPQPGLGDLDDLVEGVGAAGLSVGLDRSVDAATTAGLGLAVYRVVQEALTNALRHGGGEATVRVRGTPDAIEVEVRNPCREGVEDVSGVGGQGLIGMAERAALYGGELVAGVEENGEFVVRTRLSAAARAGDAS